MITTEIKKQIILILVHGMSKKDKRELIDSIAAGSKLTKADAGRLIASLPEKEIIEILFGMKKAELIDAIASHSKLTKADAGRALDATIASIHKKLKVVFGGKGA